MSEHSYFSSLVRGVISMGVLKRHMNALPCPPLTMWLIGLAFATGGFVQIVKAMDHEKPCGEPYQFEGKRLVFTTWLDITPGRLDWLDAEGHSVFANSNVKAGPEDAYFAGYDIPYGIRLVAEKAQMIGPIILRDRPWERMGLSIYSVIHDANEYHAWGTCEDEAGKWHSCYFESTDGLHWRQPDLGLVEYDGSKNNNLIGYDPAFVFKDKNPDAPTDERYKSVKDADFSPARFANYHKTQPASTLALEADPGRVHSIRGAVSPDGLHWKELPNALSVEESDTQVTATWEPELKQYVMYTRTYMVGQRAGGYKFGTTKRSGAVLRRSIGRSASVKFTRFPLSTLIVEPSDQMLPTDTYYTNSFSRIPAAPDERLMFPTIYHQASDTTGIDLMTSVDGRVWHRVAGSPIAKPGLFGTWDGGCIFGQTALYEMPDGTWALPFTGYRYPHKYPRGAWSFDTGLMIWPKQRLMAVEAKDKGAFATVAFLAPATKLKINAVTLRAGSIEVEVADLAGNALPGRSFADAIPIIGDQYQTVVRWKNGDDLGVVAGKPVVLRFRMDKAKLYSLDFE